jgi:hypothetical protein
VIEYWCDRPGGDYTKLFARDARRNLTIARMIGGVQWAADRRTTRQLLIAECRDMELSIDEAFRNQSVDEVEA